MAGVGVLYSNQFIKEALKKEHNLEVDTLKVALMSPSFVADINTKGTWADCSADEIAAGYGYTAGGETLTSVSVNINTTDSLVELFCDNVTWQASGGAIPTVGHAVIYNASHVNSTVVMFIDFIATFDTPDTKLFQINFSEGLGIVGNETFV